MTLLIIDGDVLAYKACRSRWKSKARIEAETNYVSLDDNGVKIPLEYTREEDAAYLMKSWENFKKDLEMLCEKLFATEYIMAMKGPDNFRDTLFDDYKGARAKAAHTPYNKQMGQFVPTIRELAIAEGMAIPAEGREADDYVRIWAEESRQHGRDFIIASIDKDLLCIPGRHYRIHKEEIVTMTPAQSMRFYYEQLLQGDPTDSIPGVPGLGPIMAASELMFCATEEQFQEVVIGHYIAAYGDDWQNNLLINGKLIHIQTHLNDYFNLKEWPLANELLGR